MVDTQIVEEKMEWGRTVQQKHAQREHPNHFNGSETSAPIDFVGFREMKKQASIPDEFEKKVIAASIAKANKVKW